MRKHFLALLISFSAHAMSYGLSITGSQDAAELVNRLVVPGSGINVTSYSVTQSYTYGTLGWIYGSGYYTGGPMGIYDGIILSNGSVEGAYPPNDFDGYSAWLYLPGNSQLETITSTTYDAVQLEIVFDADATCNSISFDFIFGTEEYPEYVGKTWNDAFGVFLNNTQVAFDNTGAPITINGPFFSGSEVVLPPLNGTEYDGTTAILATSVGVAAGSTGNVLRFIIGDVGDRILDSSVFVSSLRGDTRIVLTPETKKIVPPTFTVTPTWTVTRTYTWTFTPSLTYTSTETPTVTNTATFSNTFTATNTPTRTYTRTITNTPSATRTATDTPTNTNTATRTNTPADSSTPTETRTGTSTPTSTNTRTYTDTPTASATFTGTFTATSTATDTNVFTATATLTFTDTPTFTDTATRTYTFTATVTSTATASFTDTDTATLTYTATPTCTFTHTPTATDTQTPVFTFTPSFTATDSFTLTLTPTFSHTRTFTATRTATHTGTATRTATDTPTPPSYPYSIRVEIYNSAGELIKAVASAPASAQAARVEFGPRGPASGTAMAGEKFEIILPGVETPGSPAGFSVFEWDLRSALGQYVAQGVYTAKVQQKDAWGHSCAVTANFTVLKDDSGVELKVFNSAGEIVRTIREEKRVTAETPVLYVNDRNEVLAFDKDNRLAVIRYGPLSEDSVSWDGKNDEGRMVTSGVYELNLTIKTVNGITVTAGRKFTVLNGGEAAGLRGLKVAPSPYRPSSGRPAVIAWESEATGRARAFIYNAAGELVRVIEGRIEDGKLEWDAGSAAGYAAGAGIYCVVLEAVTGSGVIERATVKTAIIR